MAEEKVNNICTDEDIKEQNVTMTTTTTWPSSDFESYEEDYRVVKTEDTDIEIFGTDEQRQKMFSDLAKYFGEVNNPENTTKGLFNAKYSPLNEVLNTVRPILGKYGFTIIQVPTFDGTNCSINTLLTHSNGAWISFPALKNKPTKMDIQGMGSTITYLRRFSLNAITGVMGEIDDDGASASDGNSKPSKSSKKEEKEVNEAYESGMKYVTKGLTAEEKKERQAAVVAIITKFAKSGKADDLKPEDRQKVVDEIKKLEEK